MSSIIDALKKSDNNRTTESAANANQIKFGNQQPPDSRRGFWLLVVLLLLLVFGVFAWTQGWHHSAIAPVKSWFGAEPASQLTAEPTTTDSQPRTAVATTKPTTEPTNKLTPPKPNEVKAKSLAIEQAQTDSDSETQQPLEVTDVRHSLSNKDDSKVEITAEDETTEDQSVSSSPTDTDQDETETTKLIAEQNRKDLEPALKQDYLLVHQIDFEIRKNIPPIKLNIHIYDPDPENRMVILNGVKYATGDIIEELVTVEEINQQGVVLKFEGIKFLIPK